MSKKELYMATAVLIGEPNEGERTEWVNKGLEELNQHANNIG